MCASEIVAMAPQRSTSKHMLDTYLYTTNNVVDRLTQPQARTLREDIARPGVPSKVTDKLNQAKKDEAAVRRLEKQMDKITDPVLVYGATKYQQGKDRDPVCSTLLESH